ncbi:MAG: FAD:protein FMN transferase [Oscillospiraceae bacterium]
MKKSFFAVAGGLVLVILAVIIFQPKAPLDGEIFAMDTVVSFKIFGDKAMLDQSKRLTERLDKDFSFYGNGDVAKINLSGCEEASQETAEIITDFTELYQKYGNAVDVTAGEITSLWGVSTENPKIPTDEEISKALKTVGGENISLDGEKVTLKNGAKLDFGAVAKGFLCDKLKEIYDAEKVKCAIVSTGSSTLLYGEKPDKSPFTVEIKNPNGGAPLGVVKTKETFISTSGGYERFFEADGKKFHHIFDLATGYPANTEITSVTVFCDSGISSDFLSTKIFIDGVEKIPENLSSTEFMAVIATQNEVYYSAGLDFSPNAESGFLVGEIDG